MRFFGIDVHLEFCEVAVAEGGKVSQAEENYAFLVELRSWLLLGEL
jgi:hypothetical protein